MSYIQCHPNDLNIQCHGALPPPLLKDVSPIDAMSVPHVVSGDPTAGGGPAGLQRRHHVRLPHRWLGLLQPRLASTCRNISSKTNKSNFVCVCDNIIA